MRKLKLLGAIVLTCIALGAGWSVNVGLPSVHGDVDDLVKQGKPVVVLLTDQRCNIFNCGSAESALRSKAPSHPTLSIVKIYDSRVKATNVAVVSPVVGRVVYQAPAVLSEANVDAVLQDVDDLVGDLYAQKAGILKPFQQALDQVQADIDVWLQPYKDRAEEQRTKMASDPTCLAALSKIDGLYQKYGLGDLWAKQKQAPDGEKFRLWEEVQEKLAAIDGAWAEVDDADEALADAKEPFINAILAIQDQAKADFAETDFTARSDKIKAEAGQATAEVDGKISAKKAELDSLFATAQSAAAVHHNKT